MIKRLNNYRRSCGPTGPKALLSPRTAFLFPLLSMFTTQGGSPEALKPLNSAPETPPGRILIASECHNGSQGVSGRKISRLDLRDIALPTFYFGNRNVCTYCGEVPSTEDHVIARSYQTDRRRNTTNPMGPMTYSCTKCNGYLLSKYFDSFLERCACVHSKLTKKAKPILWTKAQLKCLDPSLQQYIAHDSAKRLLLRMRADWFESIDFLLNIEQITWLPEIRGNGFLFEYFRSTLGIFSELDRWPNKMGRRN